LHRIKNNKQKQEAPLSLWQSGRVRQCQYGHYGATRGPMWVEIEILSIIAQLYEKSNLK